MMEVQSDDLYKSTSEEGLEIQLKNFENLRIVTFEEPQSTLYEYLS